ncbi:uncharacterized protein LOC126846997 [Adelges cooleyi]|uniref:uncharacterized protein LOC126846997 n=1 Tax=Adelges cooleyi TaxID=133065 RepID=UPI00218041BB|nr:uncharacterized protein LOC126846997 [Adelges cooleyi]
MMNNALNAKVLKLKAQKDVDYVMNAVEFLLVVLEIKPKGLGLTLAEIEKFMSLYEANPGDIDPVECEKVFNELGITTTEGEFDYDQPTGKLLMDLVIAAAERNTSFEKKDLRVLCTIEVALAIKQFNNFDGDKDGLMSSDEYKKFVAETEMLTLEPPQKIKTATIFLNKYNGRTVNFAEFLEIILFISKR